MASVRRLGEGDHATFRAMNALFAEVFEMEAEYLGAPPEDDYVQAWLADPSNIAIVAETDGEVVGALGGYCLQKFEQSRSEIFIYDLAVARAFRRQGIASALLVETRRLASELGAWTVFVEADVAEEDEPARALYRKFASDEIMAHHFDIKP